MKTKYERGDTTTGSNLFGLRVFANAYPAHPEPRMTTLSFFRALPSISFLVRYLVNKCHWAVTNLLPFSYLSYTGDILGSITQAEKKVDAGNVVAERPLSGSVKSRQQPSDRGEVTFQAQSVNEKSHLIV